MKSVEEVLAELQRQLQAAYGSGQEHTRKELLLTIQIAKRQLAALDKTKRKLTGERKVGKFHALKKTIWGR